MMLQHDEDQLHPTDGEVAGVEVSWVLGPTAPPPSAVSVRTPGRHSLGKEAPSLTRYVSGALVQGVQRLHDLEITRDKCRIVHQAGVLPPVPPSPLPSRVVCREKPTVELDRVPPPSLQQREVPVPHESPRDGRVTRNADVAPPPESTPVTLVDPLSPVPATLHVDHDHLSLSRTTHSALPLTASVHHPDPHCEDCPLQGVFLQLDSLSFSTGHGNGIKHGVPALGCPVASTAVASWQQRLVVAVSAQPNLWILFRLRAQGNQGHLLGQRRRFDCEAVPGRRGPHPQEDLALLALHGSLIRGIGNEEC
eukprot:Sspe_Gene.22232::Locus_8421_Transcript_1_1_Confidence_1.000_Length_1750::g.22232::m.22232